MEALSVTPVVEESSGSSSESSKDSDDPVGPSQLPPVTKSNLGVSVSNKPGRARNPKLVLVIHDEPEAGTSKPASRSATFQRKPEEAPNAPTRIQRTTRPIRAKGSSTTGTLTSSTGSKPSVSFKPTKSNTLGTQSDSTTVRGMPKQRGRPPGSVSATFKTDSEEPYIPRVKINNPDPDESCIARRLSRRRGATELLKITVPGDESSSESAQSSNDESCDDSNPPVYRKSRSVLPNLNPVAPTKGDGSPPKSAPPCVRPPNPCLAPLQEPYLDVYVDGAYIYNGKGEPRAGVGVLFGIDHPLNVSRPARGRKTNNSAEIEAAVKAAQRAQEARIKRLRINTYSKYLVSSATDWIPTWKKNNWRTAENKPVKNEVEFEKLKKALEPIEVIWNHFRGHHGIEANEAADKLAREGIDGESLPILTTCNDINNTTEPTQVIIDVPLILTDSAGSDNEDMIDMGTLRKDLQKSFSQFEESVEQYSGVAGKKTVRFKDSPEVIASPIIGRQPRRTSLFLHQHRLSLQMHTSYQKIVNPQMPLRNCL